MIVRATARSVLRDQRGGIIHPVVEENVTVAIGIAGHQIEGRVRYWIIPSRLQLEAGAVLILNGEFLTQAPNANRFGNPRGSYVSLDASF